MIVAAGIFEAFTILFGNTARVLGTVPKEH
jgi:hypothetical protein